MASLNKVTLIGNVGQDPKFNTFPDGNKGAEFSVATSESWKDKATSEKKEKTEWHNVSVTNQGLVKIIERYVKKGTKLYIEGKLERSEWKDAAGNERHATKIVLKPYNGEIVLLDARGDNGKAAPVSNHDTAKANAYVEDDPFGFDDENSIPF